MILERLNVVRKTDNAAEIEALKKLGYVEVKQEPVKASKAKKASKPKQEV